MSDILDRSTNLSSDVYGINLYVNQIKKEFTPTVNEDTLMLGIFGYTGQIFSDLIQNSIVMASEFSNESIPTKAKFEKNIIAHALGLGITDINAIPATIDVILTFLEDDISNWHNSIKHNNGEEFDWSFTFDKDIPIYIGDYEFHTDYDIVFNKIQVGIDPNTQKPKFAYTAKYNIDIDNPVSDIINPYLTSPVKMNVNGNSMLFTKCTLRQVEKQTIYKKVLSDNSIAAKTVTFQYTGQLASFTIDVTEGDTTTHLIPVYEGLSVENRKYPYFYYSYLDSNTIRIKFDRYSYAPRINSDVQINIQTTQGEAGNFEYDPKTYPSLSAESEKYGYSNITCQIRPVTGESANGVDKKSIEDLQKLIPKEALSRGSITNISDLENFFNMLNSDNSILYFYKKRDNALERLYHSFIIMKDMYDVIIPTNTIDLEVLKTNMDESGKQIIQKNQCFKLVQIQATNVNGLPIYVDSEGNETTEATTDGVANTPKMSGNRKGVLWKNNVCFHKDENGHFVYEKDDEGKNICPTCNNELADYNGTYTCPLCNETFSDYVDNFYYVIPYNFVINASPLYGMYFLTTIDTNKFLDFSFINDQCIYQYISTYISWKRGYNENPNIYELKIDMEQNIDDEEDKTNKADANTVRCIAVFYDEDNNPYRWAEAKLVSKDFDANIFSFKFNFETDDYIDADNKIRINTGLYDIGMKNIKFVEGNILNKDITFYSNTEYQYPDNMPQGNFGDLLMITNEDEYTLYERGSDEWVEYDINDNIYIINKDTNKVYRYHMPADEFENGYWSEFIPENGEYISINSTIYSYDDNTESWKPAYSYAHMNANTKCTIHTISNQDGNSHGLKEKNGIDLAEIIPNGENYSLSNSYTVVDGLDFFYDYSDVVNSTVSVGKNDKGEEVFTIKNVPVVKYDYFDTDDKAIAFCQELVRRKNYIDYAVQVLEDAFGMDFKFFNTYGPSKLFTTDNLNDYLNRTNLSLTFRLKLRANYDTNIVNDITSDIKNYIEDINEINTIHIPNLVSEIIAKYINSIEFFEFVDMNGYGPSVQHLYSMEMPSEVIVPEFVNVTALPDGSPDINLILV